MKKYFFDSKHRNKTLIRKTIKKKINWLIVIGVISVLFVTFSIYIFSGLPSIEELENPRPQLATKVFSADGQLIGKFFIENRIESDIDSLPPSLIQALISTEDRKFYDHWGVDLIRFFQAMVKNVMRFSFREGASTITQQLAKNLYELKTKREDKFDIGVRKIREWISAVQIEKRFTKNEIIELYLNVSYFGRSSFGVEAASRAYFNKSATELTLPESALLIALLKSPRDYDPLKNYDSAVNRRNLVMHNMVVTGMLSEEEYEDLKQQSIILSSRQRFVLQSEAPYFLEYIRIQMRSFSNKYGFDLYRDGMNIYTSLNLGMQRIANEVSAKHIAEYQKLFDEKWSWRKNKPLLAEIIDAAIKTSKEYKSAVTKEEKANIYNKLKANDYFVDSVKTIATKIEVGFVVIDPKTGYIKAMVGGANQQFGRGLNHVTGIKRQPGSSFKPFIYTTAMENGYFPAYTLLNQKFDYNGWSPGNSGETYSGYETMRWGLTHSVNVMTGRMTISDIAPPRQVVKIAQRMGIHSHLDPYPAIALGTSEITPLEITSAYGTFPNGGVHIEPISILKIEDNNGIVIEEFKPEYVQAISPESASIMVDLMAGVVSSGTGAGVRRYFQYPAAGKTGTTQDFSDAWFVGYTPELVAGVWVGFDDHRVKFTDWYGQGAKAALPIWAMFMEGAYKEFNIPVTYFELAAGIEEVTVCKTTMEQGDTRSVTQYCDSLYIDFVNVKNMPLQCNIHTGDSEIINENKQGGTDW
ncbi:MAG: PBP1A family penicillin-binding protein [Bacteroidetes bacterium]|nr:PBP1A family penicillin-binding protein [Bacteroidota bacterium]